MKLQKNLPYKNHISILVLLAILLIVGQTQAVAGRGDWWMFGHDPQHTGSSPIPGPDSNNMKWKFTTGGMVFSSPAIGSDGTIYIASDDGNLYALNQDGTKLWDIAIGASYKSSPAIAYDGTIYIASGDGKLYAINTDGSKQWDIAIGTSTGSSPAIGLDGTIYVGSGDAKLYAINPDGTKKWDFLTGDDVRSSPAIASDGTIYVGSDDNKLYAINPDGSMKWAFTTGNDVLSSPAISSDGTIYVGSWDYRLYAINPDGSKKWQFVTGQALSSSPSIGADGTIYVGSNDYKLYAVHPDGSKKWVFPTRSCVWSHPAIDSKGNIYIGSADSSLYAINPDGSKKWEFAAERSIDSSPAIGPDGTVYFGSADNNVYAIGPGEDFSLLVSSITPNRTPNTSSVYIAEISGKRFSTGAVVKLTKSGQEDIYASNVNVESSIKISCVFDVEGKAKGSWNVVVENPDSISGMLQNGFTILPAVPIDEWQMWGHDQYHSRRSPYVGPSFPATKWSYTTHDRILSSASISPDGTIYTTSSDGRIIAFDPDGTKKWQAYLNCYKSSPAIAPDGTVYVGANYRYIEYTGTDDSHIYALNPDCTIKWDFKIRYGSVVDSSPVLGPDGTIYIGTQDGNVYAINPDGTEKWRQYTGHYGETSAVVDSGGTIYVSSNYRLYALNADGTEKWVYYTGQNDFSSPAIGHDGTVYIVGDNKLFAISPDGSKKWEFGIGQYKNIRSSPAIGSDGTVYIGSQDNKLYAVNSDGSQKWVFSTRGQIQSSPTIGSDGTIYVGSNDSKLYAINPDGSKKWAFFLNGKVISTPTISSDGIIYIGVFDGTLHAIGQSDAPAPTINSYSPNNDSNAYSPTSVSITGTEFMSPVSVVLRRPGQDDIEAYSISVISSTEIKCKFSLYVKPSGIYDFAVVNSDAQTATIANGFTIREATPKVDRILQNLAFNYGRFGVGIFGDEFVYGATIKLTKLGQPDIVAGDVDFRSYSELYCAFDLKDKVIGNWDVVVTNPNCVSGTLKEGFTIHADPPIITSITPDSALNTGPVTIELTGKGFMPDATVKLVKSGQNDVIASGVSVDNLTKITSTLDLKDIKTGIWDVVVTNTDGKSGTLAGCFTVSALYTLSTVVQLGDYTGNISGIPVVVDVLTEDGSSILETKTTALDAEGNLYIYNISPGTYKLGIKPSHWLRKITGPISITDELTEFIIQ